MKQDNEIPERDEFRKMEVKNVTVTIRFSQRERQIIRNAIWNSPVEPPRENIDRIPEDYYPEEIEYLIEVLWDMKYNGPSFPESMVEEGEEIQKNLMEVYENTEI